MKARRIPGPAIPGILQTWLLLNWPYEILRFGERRYGEAYAFKFAGSDGMVLGATSMIEEVFGNEPEGYAAGPAYAILSPKVIDKFMSKLEGAECRQVRRVNVAGVKVTCLRDYADLAAEIALREAGRAKGGRLCLREFAKRVALLFMGQLVFGPDGPPDLGLDRLLPKLDPINFPDFVRDYRGIRSGQLSLWETHVKAVIISLKFACVNGGANGVMACKMRAANDALDEPLTPDAFADQLVGIYWGAVNTLASSIQHVLYQASRSKSIQAHLVLQASRGPSPEDPGMDDGRSDYLTAFCYETFRLTPIIPLLFRVTLRPTRLGRFDVPEGRMIGISIYTAHRNPVVFPDPEVFRPERFLGRKYSDCEYLPFGSRKRSCLGTLMAPMVVRTVLSALLSRYQLEPLRWRRIRICMGNTVTVFRDPLPAQLSPR